MFIDIADTPRDASQPSILKTLDKSPKQDTADQLSPNGVLSRVTFLDKAEYFDLDNEADREIAAIMNKTPETADIQVH